MVITLERHVFQTIGKRGRQSGQLVVDQLVHERVGLGGNSHGDVQRLGGQRLREKIGYALAHAGARLYCPARVRLEGSRYLQGHLHLFLARFETRVHLPHHIVLTESRGNGALGWVVATALERIILLAWHDGGNPVQPLGSQ